MPQPGQQGLLWLAAGDVGLGEWWTCTANLDAGCFPLDESAVEALLWSAALVETPCRFNGPPDGQEREARVVAELRATTWARSTWSESWPVMASASGLACGRRRRNQELHAQ